MKIGGIAATDLAKQAMELRERAGAGAGAANGAANQNNAEVTRFADMVEGGLSAVSRAENSADDLAQRFAVGDPDVQVHDVTVAATEASLNVQMLVAVRDRAVEAYQQIINLQV